MSLPQAEKPSAVQVLGQGARYGEAQAYNTARCGVFHGVVQQYARKLRHCCLLYTSWDGLLSMASAGPDWVDFTIADKALGLRTLCSALGIAPVSYTHLT